MKRVVNGKLYDTEKAEEVASWGNGLGNSDFRHVEETLYRTKKGNWFLEGSGGPMTKYSDSNGNTKWGTTLLIPLNSEEAKEWLEERDYPEIYSEYFG